MFERNRTMESINDYFTFHEDRLWQFLADNVDQNKCTLDDQKRTFHSIGMVAFMTDGSYSTKEIARRKVLDEEILKKSRIAILEFNQKAILLKGTKFKTLENKCITKFHGVTCGFYRTTSKIQFLYVIGWIQILHESTVKDPIKKDNIAPLPVIGLNLTNMSCFLTTLSCLANLANTNNQLAVMAFDHLLFRKVTKQQGWIQDKTKEAIASFYIQKI